MTAQYPTRNPAVDTTEPTSAWEADRRHARMVADQIARENSAAALVAGLADELAQGVGPVWGWGDGKGGWVWRKMVERMEDHGFEVSTREPSVPDRVTRLARQDGWECHYCGHPLGYGHPTAVRQPIIEHVLPRSRGGRNVNDNYVLSCEWCNVQKSTMTPQEWMGEPCCDRHSNDALGVAS